MSSQPYKIINPLKLSHYIFSVYSSWPSHNIVYIVGAYKYLSKEQMTIVFQPKMKPVAGKNPKEKQNLFF